jgi:hypothetical protein
MDLFSPAGYFEADSALSRSTSFGTQNQHRPHQMAEAV